MRKLLIAGNWKMHKTVKETEEYFKEFLESLSKDLPEDREVMIAPPPPFTALYVAFKLTRNSLVSLGAQNACWEEKGAFTGEISPEMLKELGVKYVIIGHSERRHIFGETDELIAKRLKGVYERGLIPILCVGEKLEEREAGKTMEVVERQVIKGISEVKELEGSKLVVAYEPVWAIGTGKTASPEQAQEVHEFIRNTLSKKLGEAQAKKVRILYGGSVKPENVKGFLDMPDVDGVLVGGASLVPEKFLAICRA